MRQAWPHVPCVLTVRDPAVRDPGVRNPTEVLVSSLHDQDWLAHKDEPGQPAHLYG